MLILLLLFFFLFPFLVFSTSYLEFVILTVSTLRRLLFYQIEQNLSGLLSLLPEQTDELLQVRDACSRCLYMCKYFLLLETRIVRRVRLAQKSDERHRRMLKERLQ